MVTTQRISPCLWFDDQAEEAARFYAGIFRNSRIVAVTRYGSAGFEIHGRPAGSVMTVVFELDGQSFTALNGGPAFTFTEAISLQVHCATQEEVDYYWEKLSAGTRRRSSAAGSRTASGSRGRSSRTAWRRCWPTRSRRGRSGR